MTAENLGKLLGLLRCRLPAAVGRKKSTKKDDLKEGEEEGTETRERRTEQALRERETAVKRQRAAPQSNCVASFKHLLFLLQLNEHITSSTRCCARIHAATLRP